MPAFWNAVFLDNTIGNYVMVAAIILLAIFFKRHLSRYLAGLLFRIIRRIARGVDKRSFIDLVVTPMDSFLLILIILIALDKLVFPAVLNVSIYKITVHELGDVVSIIVLICSFIWLLLRIIDFIALILHRRANESNAAADNQLVVFFKDFFKAFLVISGILMVLKFAFRYQVSNLITALSIGGAAIALATRESLENLIASFIIFFDKPFTTGDLVQVHQVTGTVEKIGLRSTRLRTDQKTFVTVPNKQMVDSITDNLSLRTQRRAVVQLVLSATTSYDAVNDLVADLKGWVQSREKVENSTVFLADINQYGFVVNIEFFTAPIPIEDFNQLRQQTNLYIIQVLGQKGIALAVKDSLLNSVQR